MEDKLEKHILIVDIICKNCGRRNKTKAEHSTEMNIIACGHCGELLQIPDNMDEEEKGVITQLVQTVLKETKSNAIL